MRSSKDFIDRVVKKMGYTTNDYTVVEGDIYEEVKEDVLNGLDNGMVFLMGACINDSAANQIAIECNGVITCDIDNGVTIIISVLLDSTTHEGINIEPLGAINAFLNDINKIEVKVVPDNKTDIEDSSEHTSLKDYYKLKLPENRIGRKSDKTLIKELEEAGFSV